MNRRFGGGLTALLGLLAAGATVEMPRGPFYPMLTKGGGKSYNPWSEPNYRNTQNRTDHQHEGERTRRRRQRTTQ